MPAAVVVGRSLCGILPNRGMGIRHPEILHGAAITRSRTFPRRALAAHRRRWLAHQTYRQNGPQAVEGCGFCRLDHRVRADHLGLRHAAAPAPGTLVGAKNVEHDVWFVGDSAVLRSPAEVRRIAEQQGIDFSQPTVSFCNTGHWAATNWFVLSEMLGQPDVKLYPESMVGWSRAGLPMANVPGRLQQFWIQLKEAAAAM